MYFVTRDPYALVNAETEEIIPVVGDRILTEPWEIEMYTVTYGPIATYEEAVEKENEIVLDRSQGICRAYTTDPNRPGNPKYVGQLKILLLESLPV